MRLTTGTMTIALLAIGAGLAGAYAVRTVLLQEEPELRAETRVTVPFASDDLPAGRIMTLGDISLTPMTESEFNERNLPRELVMLSPDQIVGRTLRHDIKLGEPFLTTAVYLEGEGPDLARTLRPGFRAMSIALTDPYAVLPSRGDGVDVVFRSAARAGGKKRAEIPEATLTLFEGVRVLGVRQPRAQTASRNQNALDVRRINRDQAPPPPMVTLELTLEQVNMLRTVEGRGELSLVIRSFDEVRTVSARNRDARMTLEDLLGVEPDQEPAPFITEIYRRGARQTLVFSGDQVVEDSYNVARPLSDRPRQAPLLPPEDAADVPAGP